MANIYFETNFEETLRSCQEAVKTFQGSEETLRYIKRIEKCLRRLVDETKRGPAIKNISLGKL